MSTTGSHSESAIELVETVVRNLADELGYPQLSRPTPDTQLFGEASGIDSLSLVRIVAEVERAAGERFNKRVVLADERAMSRRKSPYRTVSTLAALLVERLAE